MKKLPESLPRWLDFVLWAILISACLAPLPQFIHRLQTNTLPANAGLLEVVFGLVGLFLLWRVGRRFVLCRMAGLYLVEATQPARVGHPMDYRISIGRPGTATLFCRQRKYRRATVTLATTPLAAAVEDKGRWTIAGTVIVPLAPASTSTAPRIEWEIDVKLSFANGAVLAETHPLRVEP
jgi:hypothetical protein